MIDYQERLKTVIGLKRAGWVKARVAVTRGQKNPVATIKTNGSTSYLTLSALFWVDPVPTYC